MEKIVDAMKKACEWCKEHWKLIATIVIVAVSIVVLLITGVGSIISGACWGAILGACIGGVSGGINSAVHGGSFLEGFENGAFNGTISDAIGGAITGGLTSALGPATTLARSVGQGAAIGAVSSGTSNMAATTIDYLTEHHTLNGALDDILYRGEPNGTEYFTTLDAVEGSGRNATTLFEGLQVKPHPIYGFRGQVSGYRFTKTVTVGYGQALANPQFGSGGLDQFYIPNVQKLIDKGILVLVDTIDLIK